MLAVAAIYREAFMANVKTAVVGGGCFWCLEAVFQRVDGVQSVVSGYAGGQKPNPTYREICNGDTGHAEVVKIEYDADKLSYGDILNWFWRCHDPTTLNRQGADVGPQYRSIILYADEAEKETAELSKAAAQAHFNSPIVTELKPLDAFYPAEADHQNYYNENSRVPYCTFVIRPKLEKLKMT